MTEPPVTVPDVVVVGAGGHGREIWSSIAALNRVERTWNVIGFVDDGAVDRGRLERLGARLLGDVGWLSDRSVGYALGIGDSMTRRAIVDRLAGSSARPVVLVDPDARVGLDVELAEGVVVLTGSTITTNVRIGRHTHLNVGCSVQHDSILGSFVQLSPGVLVNGDCVIDDDVFLGTGAIITRGCRVGRGARVGAGAVVLSDVPGGSLVVGAPARPV